VRLLLDSQALIWCVDQDHLLGREARDAIGDPSNELLLVELANTALVSTPR
jgi:PIN domain nuclease of toxin-antitoxin system